MTDEGTMKISTVGIIVFLTALFSHTCGRTKEASRFETFATGACRETELIQSNFDDFSYECAP